MPSPIKMAEENELDSADEAEVEAIAKAIWNICPNNAANNAMSDAISATVMAEDGRYAGSH